MGPITAHKHPWQSKKGGATVMIAYALGGYGNDGSITVMALFRYNYEGTAT